MQCQIVNNSYKEHSLDLFPVVQLYFRDNFCAFPHIGFHWFIIDFVICTDLEGFLILLRSYTCFLHVWCANPFFWCAVLQHPLDTQQWCHTLSCCVELSLELCSLQGTVALLHLILSRSFVFLHARFLPTQKVFTVLHFFVLSFHQKAQDSI